MKFILFAAFYCAVACASEHSLDDWDKCTSTPNGSPTEKQGISSTDTLPPSHPGEFFRPDPPNKPEQSHTEQAAKPNTRWNFINNRQFIMPCIAVMTFLAYKCIKGDLRL